MKVVLARICRVRLGAYAVAGSVMLAVGFVLGDRLGDAEPEPASFHDMRVNRAEDYTSLVDPEAPEVVALARRLGSLEAAYRFVRDEVAFEPSFPAPAAGAVLQQRRASCLGKATLLVSLYRALGVSSTSIRVVTGQVLYAGSVLEHAWVDLEYGSLCVQQDPTDLFGVHEFLQFPNQRYVDEFVRRELFCFNDQAFATVSQLNRLRGRHP